MSHTGTRLEETGAEDEGTTILVEEDASLIVQVSGEPPTRQSTPNPRPPVPACPVYAWHEHDTAGLTDYPLGIGNF